MAVLVVAVTRVGEFTDQFRLKEIRTSRSRWRWSMVHRSHEDTEACATRQPRNNNGDNSMGTVRGLASNS
ncbi:hypothetical protein J6590_035310 [Homalodisca vitripennis]|nr:hypothetical protein J6590_035310 [Homalodisca vitripennis]